MDKAKMVTALKELFVPALRARSFQGSLPHFRRLADDGVDLLTVQFDRHGGGFIIEVSRCGVDGVTTHWGKHIPAKKVRAWDLHPNKRHRLGSPALGIDGRWFRFDSGSSCEEIAKIAVTYLQEADRWWASAGRRDDA
jgi:hypothetical protein